MDLDKRAAKALSYIKSLKEYDCVLVVGHGSFGRAFKRATDNIAYDQEYKEFLPIANAGILELV